MLRPVRLLTRLGEYPIPEMISYRLAERGTRLRTPSEGEAGELMDLFTDWTSRRERRTTARRSRSRKLEQARSGYVVPTHTPTYGFKVAGERTKRRYEVDEKHMQVVRRIFEMVGVEEESVRGTAQRLNKAGVPTPDVPKKHPERVWEWRHQFVRKAILNDAYKPHTPEEIASLVAQGYLAPDVAACAPDSCGSWWYVGRDFEGNEHRVAEPVPDAGIPREVVDAARAKVADNVPLSKAGDGRFWELLGGTLYCGGCGLRMQAHAVKAHGRVYHYMRCPFHLRPTLERCPVNARLSAPVAEEAVWTFVMRLLVEPDRMVEGIDNLIELERELLRGDPEQEIRGLRAQDAYLEGAFSVEELRGRQEQIEEAKEDVLRQIGACENRGTRLRYLVDLRDRLQQRAAIWDRLLEEHPDLPQYVVDGAPMPWENDAFASAQREALEDATPEQRREHYRELGLRVVALSKDELEVSGIFGTEKIYICDPSPRPRRTATTSSASTLTGWSWSAGGKGSTSKP